MRRKARPIIYVCNAIKDNVLISKMIDCQTVEDSVRIFETENGIKPQTVYGPFYKKKTNVLDKDFDIRFMFGQNKQGVYNGWTVTMMPLLSPTGCVYVLYNKRIDGQKIRKPKACVVKLNEIQDIK